MAKRNRNLAARHGLKIFPQDGAALPHSQSSISENTASAFLRSASFARKGQLMTTKLPGLARAAFCALIFAAPAAAHDSWISRGGYRSPVSGELCCGSNDCFIVPADNVKVNGAGYELRAHETVPYSEALPSADGQYWRCQKPDGSRRCFFAPAVSAGARMLAAK